MPYVELKLAGKMKKNGFTLIELLIVVIIIGVLTALAVPRYQAMVNKAKVVPELARVRHAMELLHSMTGQWPGHLDFDGGWDIEVSGRQLNNPNYGLLDTDGSYTDWGGQYLDKPIGLDPWGQDYVLDGDYFDYAKNKLEIVYSSLGPDRTIYTSDDIRIVIKERADIP